MNENANQETVEQLAERLEAIKLELDEIDESTDTVTEKIVEVELLLMSLRENVIIDEKEKVRELRSLSLTVLEIERHINTIKTSLIGYRHELAEISIDTSIIDYKVTSGLKELELVNEIVDRVNGMIGNHIVGEVKHRTDGRRLRMMQVQD